MWVSDQRRPHTLKAHSARLDQAFNIWPCRGHFWYKLWQSWTLCFHALVLRACLSLTWNVQEMFVNGFLGWENHKIELLGIRPALCSCAESSPCISLSEFSFEDSKQRGRLPFKHLMSNIQSTWLCWHLVCEAWNCKDKILLEKMLLWVSVLNFGASGQGTSPRTLRK